MAHKRRVVVTGMDIATSIGMGATENWKNVLNNKCGIKKLS